VLVPGRAAEIEERSLVGAAESAAPRSG